MHRKSNRTYIRSLQINVLNIIFLKINLLKNTYFLISGVIRNTKPLDSSDIGSYVLSIVAYDCGMKRSSPMMLTVQVRKACNTGWTGKKGFFFYVYILSYTLTDSVSAKTENSDRSSGNFINQSQDKLLISSSPSLSSNGDSRFSS